MGACVYWGDGERGWLGLWALVRHTKTGIWCERNWWHCYGTFGCAISVARAHTRTRSLFLFLSGDNTRSRMCTCTHTHIHTHTHTYTHTHRHTKVQTYKHTHTNDCVGVRSFLALARCVVVKSSGAVHSLSLSLSRSLARSLAGTCRHSLTFTLGQCTASLAHFFVLAVPQKLATVSVN